MYRQTWLEVNLDDIADNVRKIRAICGKRIIAVLKADAYGSGDIQVCRTVLEAGAEMIAVSSSDEGLMLRNEGCQAEIMILGMAQTDDIPLLIENNIAAAAYSLKWAKDAAAKGCRGLKVQMKVDTGMNRIGFRDNAELKEALDILLEAGAVPTGIFTHFACADTSREMTDRQYLKFAEAVRYLDYPFEWIHCDNSDATVYFKDPLTNACRLGISLYGISTFQKDLKYPLAFYTRIGMVKHVGAGETIGYGATYTASEDELIATVPVGYADGFIRKNQGRKVYADGVYAEVVGRVCMDQAMIRLPEYRPEDTVVEIFGPHIPLEQMAADLETIPYEIICLVSPRVTRVYVKNGLKAAEYNERIHKSMK